MMLLVIRGIALGALSCALVSFPATLLQLWAKEARNTLLIRRNKLAIRDVVFAPLGQLGISVVFGAPGGFIAAMFSPAWQWAALAGLAGPARLTLSAMLILASGFGRSLPVDEAS